MKGRTILGPRTALRRYYNFLKSVMDMEVDSLSISDLTLLKVVSTSSITTALKKHSKLEVLRDVKQNTSNKPNTSEVVKNFLTTCTDEEFERVTGVKRQH